MVFGQKNRQIEKWPYAGKSRKTSSQKRKKKKERRKRMKECTYFRCVILSRITVQEQRARRRARQQHVAGLFLSFPFHVPVKNWCYEPDYWPNGSSKQMTYRLPSSKLWTGSSVVCVRDIKVFDLDWDWTTMCLFPLFMQIYAFVCTPPMWMCWDCLCERANLLLTCCASSVK